MRKMLGKSMVKKLQLKLDDRVSSLINFSILKFHFMNCMFLQSLMFLLAIMVFNICLQVCGSMRHNYSTYKLFVLFSVFYFDFNANQM